MENLIIANPVSIFNLFGWGFLAGSLFAFVIMMTFEWLSSINKHAESKVPHKKIKR